MPAPRRFLALALTAVLAGGVAAVPATEAAIPSGAQAKGKKKTLNVGGTVTFFVPGFDPNTNQSLASGTVNAGKGCANLRIVRVAYFTADGLTPAPNTPQPSVVTASNGSFFVALREPSTSNPPETFILRTFVEPRKTTFKGRKVNCKALIGPPTPVVVTD